MQALFPKKPYAITSPLQTMRDEDTFSSVTTINGEIARSFYIGTHRVFEVENGDKTAVESASDHNKAKQILSEKLGLKADSIFIQSIFDGIGIYAMSYVPCNQIIFALSERSEHLMASINSDEANARFSLEWIPEKNTLLGTLEARITFVEYLDESDPIVVKVNMAVQDNGSSKPDITRQAVVICNFSIKNTLLHKMKSLEVFKGCHKKDISNLLITCITAAIQSNNTPEEKMRAQSVSPGKQLFKPQLIRACLDELDTMTLNPAESKNSLDLNRFYTNFSQLVNNLKLASKQIPKNTTDATQKKVQCLKTLYEVGDSILSSFELEDLHDHSDKCAILSQSLNAIKDDAIELGSIYMLSYNFLTLNLFYIIEKVRLIKLLPAPSPLMRDLHFIGAPSEDIEVKQLETVPKMHSTLIPRTILTHKKEKKDFKDQLARIMGARRLLTKYDFWLLKIPQNSSEGLFADFKTHDQFSSHLKVPLLDIALRKSFLEKTLSSFNVPQAISTLVNGYEGGDHLTIADLNSLHDQCPQIFPYPHASQKKQQDEFCSLIMNIINALSTPAVKHHQGKALDSTDNFLILRTELFPNNHSNAFEKLNMMHQAFDCSQRFRFQCFLDDLAILLEYTIVEISSERARKLLKIANIASDPKAMITTLQIKQALIAINVDYTYIEKRDDWVVFMPQTEAYKANLKISIAKCKKELNTSLHDIQEIFNQLELKINKVDFSNIEVRVSLISEINEFCIESPPFIKMCEELLFQLGKPIVAGRYVSKLLNHEQTLPDIKPKFFATKANVPNFFWQAVYPVPTWIRVDSFQTKVLLCYNKDSKEKPKKITLETQKHELAKILGATILDIQYNGYNGYKLAVAAELAPTAIKTIQEKVQNNLAYALEQDKKYAVKLSSLVGKVLNTMPTASFAQSRTLIDAREKLKKINWNNIDTSAIKEILDRLKLLQGEASQSPLNRQLQQGLVKVINELTTTYNLHSSQLKQETQLDPSTQPNIQ